MYIYWLNCKIFNSLSASYTFRDFAIERLVPIFSSFWLLSCDSSSPDKTTKRNLALVLVFASLSPLLLMCALIFKNSGKSFLACLQLLSATIRSKLFWRTIAATAAIAVTVCLSVGQHDVCVTNSFTQRAYALCARCRSQPPRLEPPQAHCLAHFSVNFLCVFY